MKKEEFFRLLSFVRRSDHRMVILQFFEDCDQPETPTDIGDEIGIRADHVSRQLKQLAEKGLVEALNPDAPRFRYYELTETGAQFLERVRKLEEEKGRRILG